MSQAGLFDIDLRTNIADTIATIQAMPDRLRERAIMRGLNRAIDSIATNSSREVRKEYNLKDRDVKAALAKHYASKVTLSGNVTFRGRRVPLILFEARWRPGQPVGASARIRTGGGRTTYKGAFIGTHGYTGAEQVFVRVGKERYPIKILRGISIPLAVRQKAVSVAVQAIAVETFNKNFNQQIKYLTSKTSQ